MGARGNYETVVLVIQAFVEQRTWRQAELARRAEVEPRRIRRVLEELQRSGMPLEREEEHPHVYWSVPPSWFPGGVLFKAEDWQVLLEAALRISSLEKRAKLLSALLAGRVGRGLPAEGAARLNAGVVALPMSPEEEQAIPTIQEAIASGRAVRIRYFSASRGELSARTVSPSRLLLGPPCRLAAFCHRNEGLRWFRVEDIQRAEIDETQSYRECPALEVDAFLAESPDGFHDASSERHTFLVSPTIKSWVRRNLPSGMTAEDLPSGEIRVSARGGLIVVARFVVGLGQEARAESPRVAELVRQLAQGALQSHPSPL